MSLRSHDPAYQAFKILQFIFVIAPIFAGLDKFCQLFCIWSAYLSPVALQFLAGHEKTFLAVLGVIEIGAGIGVFFKPKFFSYVIAIWLFAVVLNLIFSGRYFDIALRDLCLMCAAVALNRLSKIYT